MIGKCENCHYERQYTPKLTVPEGYPKLCYNCFIKALGLAWYLAMMCQAGLEPEAAARELVDATRFTQASSAESMLRVLTTMNTYYESIAKE